MNIPAYQKKDYSYLQNAFTGLQQGMGQLQQGIQKTQEIGTREREIEQEKEYIKQLKISRQDAEKVRENAIVELASKVMDAADLPDTPAGHERAATMASQYYRPYTAQEWKDGSGVAKTYELEQNSDTFLNKIRMNSVRKRFNQPTITEEVPRTEYKEPVGQVGVEDRGTVQKPLSAFPQSVGEAQQSALRGTLTGPGPLGKTISRPQTSEDFKRYAIGKGQWGDEAKGLAQDMATQETMQNIGPEPTKEKYAEAALGQLQQPTKDFYGDLPSSQKEKKLEIEKLKAKNKGRGGAGEEVKYKDLLSERRNLENTRRQLYASKATIDDKLRNPTRIDRENGESEESLRRGREGIDTQIIDTESQIRRLDTDIEYKRKDLGYPEVPKPEPATGPSTDAQKIAKDIESTMQLEAPRGYAVVSRYGKPTWSKGKGKKTKYYTADFNKKLLEQVSNYANSLGVDIPTDKLSINLQKHSLEDVIDAIIRRSEGK